MLSFLIFYQCHKMFLLEIENVKGLWYIECGLATDSSTGLRCMKKISRPVALGRTNERVLFLVLYECRLWTMEMSSLR